MSHRFDLGGSGRPKRPDRITYLRVENYRALRRVEFKDLTPLTVLLGPNGSGKSTVFDVFAFLSECFEQACAGPGTGVGVQRN
jgi:AAA15 family ATPase/GTPase